MLACLPPCNSPHEGVLAYSHSKLHVSKPCSTAKHNRICLVPNVMSHVMPHGIDFCASCERTIPILVHVDKPDHVQELVEVLAQTILCKLTQPPLAKSTMSLSLLGIAGRQWQTARSGASTTQLPSSPPMQRFGVLSLPEVCLCTWSSAGSVIACLLVMYGLSLHCRPC